MVSDASGAAVGPSGLADWRSGQGRWRRGPLLALVGDADGGGVSVYVRRRDRPDRGWERTIALATGGAVTGTAAAVATATGALALVPVAGGVRTWELHDADGRPAAAAMAGETLPGSAVSAARVGRGAMAAIRGDDGVDLWLRGASWARVGAVAGAVDGVLAAGRRGLGAVLAERGELRWGAWGAAGWRPRATVGDPGTGPPALAAVGSGWLVAVPHGGGVRTAWIDRTGATRPGAPVTAGPAHVRGVALLRAARELWALTDEEGSLYAHRYDAAGRRWLRSACLRLLDPVPFTVSAIASVKLAQVSGEHDSQPHPGGPRPTLSRSRSTAGVVGTDLGVRADHAGRTFLLFGDTHWHRRPWLATRDAIAEVMTPDVPLPTVVFHGSPLKVRGGRVTMREYDVPLAAISHGGDLFGFFTSDHFRGGRTMGRSVLARAADPTLRIDPAARRRPIVFDHLTTWSDRYFINVSVVAHPAASLPGFAGAGDVWLLFGSGAYRAGDLRLAVIDPRAPDVSDALRSRRPVPLRALRPRYWAGSATDAGQDAASAGAAPVWCDDEADAVPLLTPGAFGEISVRWVPEVGRFLLLAGNGPEDPVGPSVLLRSAPQPWGPWSPRHRLFDWVADGMSFGDAGARFIKAHGDGSDPVGDRVFRAQRDATGAAYAPYLFDARRAGDTLVVRYTLSTWNPYQVVLMEHLLDVRALASGPGATG